MYNWTGFGMVFGFRLFRLIHQQVRGRDFIEFESSHFPGFRSNSLYHYGSACRSLLGGSEAHCWPEQSSRPVCRFFLLSILSQHIRLNRVLQQLCARRKQHDKNRYITDIAETEHKRQLVLLHQLVGHQLFYSRLARQYQIFASARYLPAENLLHILHCKRRLRNKLRIQQQLLHLTHEPQNRHWQDKEL